jgi:hypothetical protein
MTIPAKTAVVDQEAVPAMIVSSSVEIVSVTNPTRVIATSMNVSMYAHGNHGAPGLTALPTALPASRPDPAKEPTPAPNQSPAELSATTNHPP